MSIAPALKNTGSEPSADLAAKLAIKIHALVD
jgi:hypothetical protein